MAGSLIGNVQNGEFIKTDASKEATKSSNINTSKTEASKGTEYNEEMILQLLVAEMQYQDPLEPTDNSQYVSQLASFSQIEAIQSVQSDMKTIQANSLVGKVVMVNDDNNLVTGKVDLVSSDEDGIYLSINGQAYSVDKLDSVFDESYYNAVITAEAWIDSIKKLPDEINITVRDADKVNEARQLYNAMDLYTKQYIDEDSIKKLEALEKRIAAINKSTDSSDTESDEG